VPLRETVWGLAGALSVTESVPVSVPVVLGVNVTFIVQFAPEARLTPLQLSLSPKFALAVMPTILSGVVP
jgi:hypothetical protein